MLHTQTEATTPTTSGPQQEDVVEEFCDAAVMEEALFSVQRDLEERPISFQGEELQKEWIELCLCVLQDLKHGEEMTRKCEKQTNTRRYPLRKRLSRMEVDEMNDELAKRQAVVGRKERKENKNRASKAPSDQSTSESSPSGSGSGQEQTTQDDMMSDVEMEQVATSEHPQGGATSVEDDMQIDDSEEEPQVSCSAKRPTVSLQDVIASFKNWKKEVPTTVALAASLPPLSEGFEPEMIQPRAMHMEPGLQQGNRNAPREDSSAMQVYVMPSGYIVQSVQLVLAKQQAARIVERPPVFRPMFQPLLYTLKQHPSFYIPVWQPLEGQLTHSRCVELDVQLKVMLSSPRSQILGGSYQDSDINVGSFFSRLDESHRGWCLPQASMGTEPLGQDGLEERVNALLSDLEKQTRIVEDGSQEKDSVNEETQSVPTEIEKLLQNFSQRLEKFYEE